METYTTFEKGETVRAVIKTKSLKVGAIYKVHKVLTKNREIFEYVYFVADAAGDLILVRNGHLVLGKVAA